jgi:hypothetical protein
MGITQRIAGAAGMRVARKLSRSFPIVGTVVAIALLGRSVRRKGFVLGLVDAGADALPIVGTLKAVVELMRGDFIPDRVIERKPPDADIRPA